MDREERRALLEHRRAVVARQLRGLAIELTDLDRQLDDIEQFGTHPGLAPDTDNHHSKTPADNRIPVATAQSRAREKER